MSVSGINGAHQSCPALNTVLGQIEGRVFRVIMKENELA